MKAFINKHKRIFTLFILLLSLLIPFKSSAHTVYFFQVLIDAHKYQYMGTIVEDSVIKEASHIETQIGKFGGLSEKVNPLPGNKEDDFKAIEEGLNDEYLTFSFSPIEVKKWYGAAKNNATAHDANLAYFAQENLMVGLNEALQIVNGGKPFTSVESMMKKGKKLADAISSGGGTVDGYKISIGKHFDGKPPEGVDKKDYITITKKGSSKDENEVYEFIYQVKKGYKTDKNNEFSDKYSKDVAYLNWNMLMYQANYAYTVKGYTVTNGQELDKPNPVEQAVVGLLGNMFNQLRNLLGLYDINDLVFNDGIRGSSAWTHGVMSKQWSDKSITYHWIFQALAWSVIIFAIVKALIQRNFATINPAMRISLMENIQNLLITGFLLANAIPVINMLMFLNFKLVAVFGATAPEFGNLAHLNAYSNMIGGILVQFFYLGVSIYLNFVYIMRSITLAILIASAPLFIVTIALGGKWRELFNTWMKEIVGNIFLQSFHAFMLSFFFTITTSSRGIEGMIVLLSLIPMTEFFKSIVMGNSGGIAGKMGMQSMQQAGSLVGGALATASGMRKSKSGGRKTGGESGHETSSYPGDTIGNFAGNSEKVQNNSSNMTQRQRLNSTQNAMATREFTGQSVNRTPDKLNEFKLENVNPQVKPETKGQMLREKIEGVKENLSQAKENFDNSPAGSIAKTTAGALKVGAGLAQGAVGVSTAMAVGASHPHMTRQAIHGASAGLDIATSGAKQTSSGMMSTLPESTSAYATSLPNGDLQIHRPIQSMSQQGIVDARMEGTSKAPIAKYTYDSSKLSSAERNNLSQAYNAFQSKDPSVMQHYQAQGVQNVTQNAEGNYVVRYNQNGMNKMGIKSVQTIGGSGNNGRIVETKAVNAPDTLKMVSFEQYKPTQTSGNNQQQNNKNHMSN